LLSKTIYRSEQVCIGWRSTGAYCTAKLTFSHGSPVKVWGACCTSVRIVFEILWYCITLEPGKLSKSSDVDVMIRSDSMQCNAHEIYHLPALINFTEIVQKYCCCSISTIWL